MSETADLLEWMRGACGRWRTVSSVTRTWGDMEGSGIALRRLAEQHNSSVAIATIGGSRVPASWETISRKRVDRLGDRERLERTGDSEERFMIRCGPRWWSYTEQGGSTSNDEDSDGRLGITDPMLDPSLLLPAFDFAVTGATVVAGRAAIVVSATPRRSAILLLLDLGPGADELVLAVDAERGVLLRVEARIDGHPFKIHEVTEVAFDEDLDDELFQFVSPDGSPIRSARSLRPVLEKMSVEAVDRRASFTVLAPTRLRDGWTTNAVWQQAMDRPASPEGVTVHVRSASLEPLLQIHQAAQAHPGVTEWEWERVERGGRDIELFHSVSGPGPGTYLARTEIAGTHVLTTGSLGREETVDVVTSLEPFPG